MFCSWSSVLGVNPGSCEDLVKLLKEVSGEKKLKKLTFSLIYSFMWTIWKARIGLVFRKERPDFKLMFDDFCVASFNWVKSRSRMSIDWSTWCISPISTLYSS